MSEKLEVEIIDSGDGSASALSPDDFASVREFNKALARLKAAARAKEFEENQELKARKQIVKDQKMTFDEEKAVKKKEIEQTRLTVQEMKAKRQLDVVIGQQQRAREAEINKRDRHREMMLRHVLGAVNPNSTFQYRMSSIYGLLNTAGITSQRDVSRVPGEGEGVQQRVGGILQSLSDGLKTLFGQTGSFFRGAQAKGMASQVITTSPATTAAAGMAKETITSVSPPEEEMPWWWGYKPKGFKPTDRDKLQSINRMISGEYKPLGIRSNVPALQPANIKMAIPVQPGAAGGIGGGGFPPIGGSPAGPLGGGSSFTPMLLNAAGFIGKAAIGLGVFAAGTSLVVGGLTTLYGALNLVSRRFVTMSEELKTWSISLTMAKTETTLRTMAFNMERAQKFGPELAQFERSKTTADIGFTKLYDSITMPFLPLVTGSYNLLGKIADGLSELIDMVFTFTGGRFILDVVGEIIGTVIPNFWFNINNPDGSRGGGAIIGMAVDIAKAVMGAISGERTPNQAELSMARGLAEFLNMPVANTTGEMNTFSFSGFSGTMNP